MNRFIKTVLSFALKNKFFVFFVTALLAAGGYISFKNISIDAFPDVTNTSVTIISQWPGNKTAKKHPWETEAPRRQRLGRKRYGARSPGNSREYCHPVQFRMAIAMAFGAEST